MIERVQRKVLRISAFQLDIRDPSHDYTPVPRAVNISTLADRRHAADLYFLSNLLTAKIDSTSLIHFRVPARIIRHG